MSAREFAVPAVFVLLASAAAAAEPAPPLVHVSGRGVVRVVPDQVVVELTVTTVDDDLIRVRRNSDQDARTILTLATKHGVDPRGFEVSRLELMLDYNEQLRRQIYHVERDVTLELNDLRKLDALLSDLLLQRNLEVVGISFVSSQARQHEFEARKRAVADAKEKAEHLAELSGYKLGKARDIRVSRESHTPFFTSVSPVVGFCDETAPPHGPENRPADADDSVASAAASGPQLRLVTYQAPDAAAPAAAKPFALGMIEVTAQVTMDFELAE